MNQIIEYMAIQFNTILEIVIGLISAYLLYYVHKKGQNQADKEDLKKLTEIVEDVKMKNSKEIESIKANLSLLTDRGKQIFSEEKDSIIVFFAQLNTWIWEGLNINIKNFSTFNIGTIKERLLKMQDASNKTNVAFAKVMLIIDDDELIKQGQEAIKKTYDIYVFRGALLIELRKVLEEQTEIQDRMNRMNPGSPEDPDIDYIDYRDAYNEIQEKINERDKLVEVFTKNNSDVYNLAMEAVNTFKDLARDYIRKESTTN